MQQTVTLSPFLASAAHQTNVCFRPTRALTVSHINHFDGLHHASVFMAKDVAMDHKFPGKCLEAGLVGNGARPVIGAEWQRYRILPTPQWIILGKFGSVDMCDQEWIDD